MPVQKVTLAEKFDSFTEQWSPKIVASVDDYDVKIVRIEGEFVWHKHDDDDEMFLVVDGAFDMHFRDNVVTLSQGEMIVVPKGIEHKPVAASECRVMVLEKSGVVNTGDAAPSELTAGTGERI
jgi:mannose-6-phosphate isomerase-like protein (cupin superfamily)